MSAIQCFLLEETGNTVRSLRRFTWSKANVRDCPGAFGYHNADTPLDVIPTEQAGASGDTHPHDDPRWPVTCDCGYLFTPADQWQVFHQHEMRRTDTGTMTTLRDAPAGAMWWAPWMAGFSESAMHKARGGGPHLILKTPAGDWDIDAPSTNGQGWVRTGTPPLIVVQPSIGIGDPFRYHGWLGGGSGDQPGVLVDC